ncbi:hypothetical protein ASG17_04685 [Brevundimonas sp. Leaf363]|nr:hypothetical protein ASG17_04685 [Brevundimonas sp. Leaf363]
MLFAACQLVGLWSAHTFHATVLWPANAVLVAALLQLHRRQALTVLAACVAVNLGSNIVRGDPGLFGIANVILNVIQAGIATILARRFCGAALDMRRPRRLFRFALLAAVPAVAVSTVMAAALALSMHRIPLGGLSFRVHHLFDMELLALMIVAPSLLLLARKHRFRTDDVAPKWEAAALLGLVLAVSLWVFGQSTAPILFAVLPPLVLLAFRLSPPWTAAAVILVAAIGGFATVIGHGPVPLTVVTPDPALAGVPDIMRQMNVFHLFLLGIVATALPITTVSTERRRLTARLKAQTAAALAARERAEKADAAKSRFLALMSHEMRTPLTGIAGYSDVLSRAPGLNTETRRQIDAIRVCGDAMLRLVEDVLEVSRGGDEVAMAVTDLNVLIEEAVSPARAWAAERGLSFELLVTPDVGSYVCTDGRRLRQALQHIAGNAAKFTSKGGVCVAVDRVGDRLRFVVSDTGCGMGDDLVARIFNLFEQVDPSISRVHEGAGIGLALAKAHVDRLGGTIAVRSAEGHGSTFTLEVPAAIAEAPVESASAAADPRDDDQPLRVLIVDDHPTNRDLLRIMLQAAGCETQEAADGQEAVDAVAAATFDIVLMDVRMPIVDGLAATRAIRAMASPACDVPILAVTAEAMPEDAARCVAAGMDGHLAKPVTQAKLYDAVELTLAAAAERAKVAA